MYTVKIWICSKYASGTDIEEIDITSEKSLQSAKNKASRWINKHLFASDYDSIEKEQISRYSKRADWTIR